MKPPDIEGKTPAQQVEAIDDFIIHELALAQASTARMTRGRVLPLTQDERVARALYLAGSISGYDLDSGIRSPISQCPTLSYMLHTYNGGKDPTAPHPADVNLATFTADCIGGAAWVGGFDRYQPIRFAHIYDGWINTDSMIIDARGPMRCFIKLAAPEPGCFVVCASGSPGHRIGHIGTVVEVPPSFDRANRDHWHAMKVVDVAARAGRANAMTTASGWFGTDACFVRSVMKP